MGAGHCLMRRWPLEDIDLHCSPHTGLGGVRDRVGSPRRRPRPSEVACGWRKAAGREGRFQPGFQSFRGLPIGENELSIRDLHREPCLHRRRMGDRRGRALQRLRPMVRILRKNAPASEGLRSPDRSCFTVSLLDVGDELKSSLATLSCGPRPPAGQRREVERFL